jgi:hypothetical protein
VKALIAICILLVVFWIGQKLLTTYQQIERKSSSGEPYQDSQVAAPASNLPGVPESLEPSLEAARQQGAAGLRNWLATYGPHVRDPRLAAIELDYVVLISHQDPAEAKRVFKAVQARTPPASPVYSRVKGLERAFQ